MLANEFSDTPPDLQGRGAGCGAVLADARRPRQATAHPVGQRQQGHEGARASAATRSLTWSRNTNALLAAAADTEQALDQISATCPPLAQQLKGFIAENRATLKPALDKLNGVLAIVDNRKERLQKAIKGLNSYGLALGESVSSGPFFKAYRGQPASRAICPALHRRRLLRPRPRPGHPSCQASLPIRRSVNPERRPADAVSTDRSGRRTASETPRRHHRQARRSASTRCDRTRRRRRPAGRRRDRPARGPPVLAATDRATGTGEIPPVRRPGPGAAPSNRRSSGRSTDMNLRIAKLALPWRWYCCRSAASSRRCGQRAAPATHRRRILRQRQRHLRRRRRA